MKHFRRITSLVLMLVFLTATFGTSSFAATSDYTIKDGALTAYNGRDVELVIPENLGITRIEMYAFTNSETVTTVTIPSTVKYIDSRAFQSCWKLTSISVATGNANYASSGGVLFSKDKKTLVCYPCGKKGSYIVPSAVTDISMMAFINCAGLSSVTFSEGIKTIGQYAFFACPELKTVTIPASVTTLEAEAFGACRSLTNFSVADGNVNYASLDGVLFSKNMTTLICFPGGRVGSYSVPQSVRTIGYCAFQGCDKLFGVTIPLGVTRIEASAFTNCTALTKVIISSTVTEIDSSAFSNCPNMTIYGKAGSAADTFAKANSISFLPLTTTASPTASPVLVNGTNVKFEAYSINDNNYFKLRDLAKVISGTDKQFEITFDAAKHTIYLTTGKAYTTVGGELTPPTKSVNANAQFSIWTVYLNGTEISLKAYEINGNNYFKLRDVGEAIDFGVTWNEAKSTIAIDTSTGYVFE